MEKIKKITLHVKKWQVGLVLAVLAYAFAYIMAITMPDQNQIGLIIFHIFGMLIAGVTGTVFMVASYIEMWEKWDA